MNSPLDDGLFADGVTGTVKLTRLTDANHGEDRAEGDVELAVFALSSRLSRTLFDPEFTEEFRIAHDVRTGIGIATAR